MAIKKLSFKQYEELRRLWKEGVSKEELASYFQVHSRTISRWMSEAGLGRPSGHQHKDLDTNEQEESNT